MRTTDWMMRPKMVETKPWRLLAISDPMKAPPRSEMTRVAIRMIPVRASGKIQILGEL
jgi:hypothetical protein